MEESKKEKELEIAHKRQQFQMHKKGYEDVTKAIESLKEVEKPEVQKVELQGVSIVTIKGDKGDKPTTDELKEIIQPLIPTDSKLESLIKPLIPKPLKGEDGKDYIITEKDKKEIAKSIKVPVVEKVIEKQIIEKPTITEIVKEVAKYEDAEVIADKLSRVEKQWLSIEAIKGDFNSKIKQIVHTGGATGVLEAPQDNKQYARKDGMWVEVAGDGIGDMLKATYDPVNGAKQVAFADDLSSYLKLNQTTPQTTVGRFTFPNIAVDTNTIYTDSVNHRLGVGTTNPNQKLTIQGDSYSATFGMYALPNSGGVAVRNWGLRSNYISYGDFGIMQSTARDGDPITAGTTRLYFDLNGNVGIGTTTPTYKLDVRGTTTNDSIRSAMGFDIYQVPDPTAPTGVVSAGGSVNTGTHYYLVSYTTALGETHSVNSSVITTTTGNNTVTLTIPVSTDPRVTGRKIYRTKAGEALYQDYLLATISNNTDVTYVDTVADSSLTGSQGASYFKLNTTSKNITVSGTSALIIDSKGTILGYGAGRTLATGGRYTIFGKSAGSSLTTASDANLFGENAGLSLTTGNSNDFFGYNVGLQITTGYNNSGFGHDAMVYAGSSSSENAMFGYGAGWGVQTNSYTGNSGFGAYALFSNTTGTANSAVGYQSLYSNASGGYNSAIGYRAGRYIADGTTARITGDYGLYLGTGTKASSDGTTNEIVIGYNAIGNGSNTITFGNSSITDNYFKGTIRTSKYQLNALNTAPSSANDTGVLGEIRWVDGYVYLCVATNTWKRASLSTW